MPENNFRLPKKKRICNQTHFKNLFANARKIENNCVIIYYAKAFNESAKAAFVGSKKVGNSTVRNHCKRILREFYRLQQNKITKDFDFVFVAKKKIVNENFLNIEKSILALLENNHLII